jgi:HK97 family phage major capsid protein
MKKSHLALLGLAALLAIAVLAVPEAQQLLFTPLDLASLGSSVLAAGVGGAAVVSSNQIRALQRKKADVVAKMRELSTAAGDNQFTAEQQTQYAALRAQRDALDDAIVREADLVASEAQLGTAHLPDGTVSVTDNAANDPKMGFKAFGEYARAVLLGSIAIRSGGRIDERLVFGDVAPDGSFHKAAAPTTFGNELSGVDGGFLIPPQFANDIFVLSLGEDSFLPYTDNVDLDDGNGMVFPKDETTPWGTDGVRMFWQAEAAAGTQNKPKLSTLALRLHKLLGLVPVTDELAGDARALSSYLPKLLARSLRWKVNDAIINGTGAGQPQGVTKSGAVVTVSKDSGQAANTLTILNLANMMAQLPNGSYGSAFWMIHNTVLGALFTLNSSGFPYYLPFGAGQGPLAKSPFGTLLGRPVIISQHAAAFSGLGDVQLHDLSYYQTITKGGPQTATSMHLYFDADAMALRMTFRVDGKSKIAAAITQNVGTPKLSPYLILQNR